MNFLKTSLFLCIFACLHCTVFTQELPGHFSHTFTGLIDGKSPVQMRLRRDSAELSGWYAYTKGEKFYLANSALYLSGTIDNTGNFNLEESDENGKITGIFKGRVKVGAGGEFPRYEISGTWQKNEDSPQKALLLKDEVFELAPGSFLYEDFSFEKTDNYTITLAKPALAGFKNNEFLQTVNDIYTQLEDSFKRGEDEREPPDTAEAELIGATTSALDGGYNVAFADSTLTSLIFNFYLYSAGAAHGNTFTQTLNYDLRANRPLALHDIFKSEKAVLKAFSAYARKELLQRKISDKDWIYTGTEPVADNFRSWSITAKGILLTFDQYQVASYAEGPQEVIVPYSVVKNLLKSGSLLEKFF